MVSIPSDCDFVVPQYKEWLFNTQGQGTSVKDMLTSNFALGVTAMLNVDGTKMVMFGKDAAGKGVSGVMTYPTSATSGFTVRRKSTVTLYNTLLFLVVNQLKI